MGRRKSLFSYGSIDEEKNKYTRVFSESAIPPGRIIFHHCSICTIFEKWIMNKDSQEVLLMHSHQVFLPV